MYDKDGLGMFVLPCAHVYHIYCFAHLATSKETCMGMGCMQTISPVARLLVMLGHTSAPSYGVESRATSAPVKLNSAIKTTIEFGMHSISMYNLDVHYLFLVLGTWVYIDRLGRCYLPLEALSGQWS